MNSRAIAELVFHLGRIAFKNHVYKNVISKRYYMRLSLSVILAFSLLILELELWQLH